jgi:hypothetical protein
LCTVTKQKGGEIFLKERNTDPDPRWQKRHHKHADTGEELYILSNQGCGSGTAFFWKLDPDLHYIEKLDLDPQK